VLEFGGGEPPRLQRWELRRTLDGPDGAGQEQRYVCTLHQPSSAGAGGRLEEWVENPPPTGMVAQRVTVWKAAEGASPTAADLSFRFPKGTHVTDTREDTPVEYEQTEDGVDEEDVAQLARALQQGRVGVGAAAPDLQFEVPRKKPLRLSEHRGKVVVLFWFSPRTPYAESAGKFLFELSEAYRKKGVVFLGVAVDASGDGRGDEAQEFRKQAKWSFPVVTEAENEGLRRMGPVIAVPKIAVVDAVGVVAYVQAGITAEKIVEVLNRLTARAK
jgi:peroxiredoxin